MSSEPRQKSKRDRQPGEDDTASQTTSESQESIPSRLPFEPSQNRKKGSKKAEQVSAPKPSKLKANSENRQEQSEPASSKASAGIPEVVSKRMVRRMALFSGIPTGLGMLTFIVSYIIVSQHIAKLPTIAVLLVSLGFFGLGVLGLSYGSLSASWDEDRLGTWLGWSEFRTNFGRTIDSWRDARQKAS